MKPRTLTLLLVILTVIALAVSVPASLQRAWQRGGFHVFSKEFFEEIPMRLSGPGRFRFIFQPLMAVILGIRDARRDAKAGKPRYLVGLFGGGNRREMLGSALASIVNLLLVGILLDSVFQWILLGTSYPGPALIVGPVLIALPYSLARTLARPASA